MASASRQPQPSLPQRAVASHVQSPPGKQHPTDQSSPVDGCSGGSLGRQPAVWALTAHKPGHTPRAPRPGRGARGAAHDQDPALSGVDESPWATHRPHGATRFGVDTARSDSLPPPWPDLILTAGGRPARVARWIQQQCGGRTRLVVLRRKGGRILHPTDVSVSRAHFRLPPHPRRIETLAPLTHVNPERLRQGAAQWQHLVQDAPHPWIMLLVGGATARHQFDPQIARKIGADVRAFATRSTGESVYGLSRSRRDLNRDGERIHAG